MWSQRQALKYIFQSRQTKCLMNHIQLLRTFRCGKKKHSTRNLPCQTKLHFGQTNTLGSDKL